ncbi:MAG: hypothetical protein SGI77_20220 [Pirellulaceae bacterium]|nr:hypothetical protein [Pirellulaceae bacterium]
MFAEMSQAMLGFFVAKIYKCWIVERSARLLCLLGIAFLLFLGSMSVADEPVKIGSRRELFVDRLLIDRLIDAELRMHHPVKATRPKSPLPVAHYITILKDSDRFRAYWRGSDPLFEGEIHTGHGGETVEYAESLDGHEWTFPDLRLLEVSGKKHRNVILANQPPLLTNFSPFIDNCPDVSNNQRYKALGR